MRRLAIIALVLALSMLTLSSCDILSGITGSGGTEQGTPDEIFNHPKNPRLKEFLSKVIM